MHAALRKGHIEAADLLIESCAFDMRAMPRDEKHKSPAHYAAHTGKLESLQWLVQHSQSSPLQKGIGTHTTTDVRTPLHYAAARGHLECLQYLSSAVCGGNIHCKDERGLTLVYLAAQEGMLFAILVSNISMCCVLAMGLSVCVIQCRYYASRQ